MHRSHLFSLRIAHALRETLESSPYGAALLGKDLMAGVTVGIIAIPLSMALAIASGVPPQYGLYTAIIAGLLIALTGGSRYSVSGPTAAFVVILYPIAQSYGLAGLLLATVMAGVLLVMMAVLRLGRLIEYIPEPVTLGFTSGIAVVIATLQVKDLLGLPIANMPEHYLAKVMLLIDQFHLWHWPTLSIAALTLVTMVVWKRLGTPVPAHLPAVVLASLAGWWFAEQGMAIDTIGSRFEYLGPDGAVGHGIPPFLPEFTLPWNQPGPDGQDFVLSWPLIVELLPAAFAIAMLGAIESLLCAVVLDGATGTRHSANSELLGQGIGNIAAPFFGGISATAAIARSSANVRAGAYSPISAAIHALVVLLSLMVLARWLAYVPMAGMAGLLVMVAWNMSEAPKGIALLRKAPPREVLVFVVCFVLTVLFDMVIAITAGILLAALLFMHEIAQLTRLTNVTDNKRVINVAMPTGWVAYKINGPLFFAAADRVFGQLGSETQQVKGVLLYLDGVSVLDSGGVAALLRYVQACEQHSIHVYLADWQPQPLETLKRSGFSGSGAGLSTFATLDAALSALQVVEAEDTH